MWHLPTETDDLFCLSSIGYHNQDDDKPLVCMLLSFRVVR